MKSAKCEGKALVVDRVDEAAARPALHDDVADVLAEVDILGIERRRLARLLGQHEIARFDASAPLQEIECPSLVADGDDAGKRRH